MVAQAAAQALRVGEDPLPPRLGAPALRSEAPALGEALSGDRNKFSWKENFEVAGSLAFDIVDLIAFSIFVYHIFPSVLGLVGTGIVAAGVCFWVLICKEIFKFEPMTNK